MNSLIFVLLTIVFSTTTPLKCLEDKLNPPKPSPVICGGLKDDYLIIFVSFFNNIIDSRRSRRGFTQSLLIFLLIHVKFDLIHGAYWKINFFYVKLYVSFHMKTTLSNMFVTFNTGEVLFINCHVDPILVGLTY